MKLLFESEDEIPQDLRDKVKPAEGGGFEPFEHDGATGYAYENVGGLKTTLAERKEAHRKAQEKLKAFEGLDATKVREQLDELERLRDAEPDEKVKSAYEAKIAQLQEKSQNEIRAREEKLTQLESDVREMVVDRSGALAISKHGGSEKLLMPVIRSTVRAVRDEDTGKWIEQVLDQNGNPRVSMRNGQNGLMTLDEYVETLKKDPDYQGAFKGAGAAGSGAPGSNGAAGGSGGMDALSKLPPAERLVEMRKRGISS